MSDSFSVGHNVFPIFEPSTHRWISIKGWNMRTNMGLALDNNMIELKEIESTEFLVFESLLLAKVEIITHIKKYNNF